MRVLVCGSRDWTDGAIDIVGTLLSGFYVNHRKNLTVIEGGAKGADAEAAEFAETHAGDSLDEDLRPIPGEIVFVKHEQYPADWDRHGTSAGPIRNQRMLDEGKPDVVIAFKDGFQRDVPNTRINGPDIIEAKGGTEDMVRRAKAAGIPVYIVSHG